ncbi:uncharacterized protein LOC110069547 [Orbicella faveolata]|uniref:uncharacterized protein LOC110069547 n=1 Tax=Orbicella faveolata TaxID=48498 RepID=UPI0009E4D879|nr:uncharacterized protein LOC110069547 [Orbicella faveolata]
MKLILFYVLFMTAVSQEKLSSKAIHLEMKGFIPRSCLDYLRDGIFGSDFYWLFDSHNKRYVTYCDFSSEPGSAWTLVMSWNRASKDLPHFRSKTFLQDAPINHKTPNWNSYRQTLARMKILRSQSKYWRATCSFDQMQQKIDYRDYLRGKFSDFDIMTYVGEGKCFPVDYANIRGHVAGSGTTARFWQVLNTYTLHTDSFHIGDCAFKPNTGAVSSEDNFGFYGVINKNFRCTMANDSTTQWWFGGYLDEL